MSANRFIDAAVCNIRRAFRSFRYEASVICKRHTRRHGDWQQSASDQSVSSQAAEVADMASESLELLERKV